MLDFTARRRGDLQLEIVYTLAIISQWIKRENR